MVEVEILRWIVALPLASAGLLGFGVAVLRREVAPRSLVWWSTLPLVGGFALSWYAFAKLVQHGGDALLVDNLYSWVGGGVGAAAFSADLALQLDSLTAVMCIAITAVGALVLVHASATLPDDDRPDSGSQRFFCLANLALASALLAVLADNLLVFFLGWVCLGLFGSVLMGFWYSDETSADASSAGFIADRFGDWVLLIVILLVFTSLSGVGAPTVTFRGIQAHFPEIAGLALEAPVWLGGLGGAWPLPSLLALGVLVAACTRAGQLPFQVWWPQAGGPAPAAALVQSVTSVGVGIYLVCRLSYVFALAPEAATAMAWLGAATALLAAGAAAVQRDLLRLLTYSTMSQLGLALLAAGCGAYGVALFQLLAHAFAKVALLLAAGTLVQQAGERDIWRMGGLRAPLWRTHAWMWVAALTLAGLPPLAGFFAQGEVLVSVARADAVFEHRTLFWIGLGVVALTAFTLARALFVAFGGDARATPSFRATVADPGRPAMPVLGVLTVFAAIAGLLTPPQFWGDVLGVAGSDSLGNFVAPVLAAAPFEATDSGARWRTAGLQVLAFGLGLAAAWGLYVARPVLADRLAMRLPALHRLLERGFYVDALWRWLVVRPVRFVSDRVLYRGLDRNVIDAGAVTGGANLLRGVASHLLKYSQSGLTQGYLLTMLVGALAIALYLARWG